MDRARVDRHIRDLEVGEGAYTVPWSMTVDDERHCWIDPGFTAHAEPQGTVCMRVERRDDGVHVDLSRVDEHTSWTTGNPRHDSVPVRGFFGGIGRHNFEATPATAHPEGDRTTKRPRALGGVARHLSDDFLRQARAESWPLVEMARAVADALDREPSADWERIRQHLVRTAPAGTLDGGRRIETPAPSRFFALSIAAGLLRAMLTVTGLLGFMYVVTGDAAQRAVDAVRQALEPYMTLPTVVLESTHESVTNAALTLGLDERILPTLAFGLLLAAVLRMPKPPALPTLVSDARWRELLSAVLAHRIAESFPTHPHIGAPAVETASVTLTKNGALHVFYDKPTLFRITRVTQLHTSTDIHDAPVVDMLCIDPATGSFEEQREVVLTPKELSKGLLSTYRSTGQTVIVGYLTKKRARHGRDVECLLPLDADNAPYGVEKTTTALLEAATYIFDWWTTFEEAVTESGVEEADPSPTSSAPRQRIDEAKSALADLDGQWLAFTTDTTPIGLRAYYFDMPALWRKPAAPIVAAYETALFELREIIDELPVEPSAEAADRVSHAAEHALNAWSEAQQYAISVGVDDGRSIEEKTAARRLPELLNQFLDPSTTASQADRLRTLIEAQMSKLTTRPGIKHLEAVNAGAQRLHRAPVLAAIES
ncbi:Uncharacterised protein (plasmid) [Tsukamurella tyrosinosolvens]|uniref:Uncharacterized protein n=3 Tax=Tsukamurella tyrosinosolvens TaxID=57704 RepID=A0A1H4U4C0_TSUTY|nr:hypothetical protein AXK58_14265 [Tsukamurella tyrosinosolvens]SEC63084.1 hypothetical protein SAMN04489793_2777 [Tsukamurella tyrosinosolvens]VEH93980.1 Uncharacterised protein [Tsukamurella tyrosinosolvens]